MPPVTPPGAPALAVQSSERTDLGTLGGGRAFSWTAAGGMAALPAQATHACGVNAAGQIVGRGVSWGFVRRFAWGRPRRADHHHREPV